MRPLAGTYGYGDDTSGSGFHIQCSVSLTSWITVSQSVR